MNLICFTVCIGFVADFSRQDYFAVAQATVDYVNNNGIILPSHKLELVKKSLNGPDPVFNDQQNGKKTRLFLWNSKYISSGKLKN